MEIVEAYAELGLAPGASEREIKAAWRRLVSRWHPDRNPSPQAIGRMQRLNHAFEALRSAGRDAPAGDAAPPDASAWGPADPPPAADPASKASRARGGAPNGTKRGASTGSKARSKPGNASRRRTQSAPGDNSDPTGDASASAAADGRVVHRKVRLTLEEAALGCTKSLQGRVVAACTACDAAGWRPLRHACVACDGAGQVRQATWFGWSTTYTTCEACLGTGQGRQRCPACDGTGKAPAAPYKLSARLPAGVRDGDVLQVRVPPSGARAPSIAIELRIEIAPHEFFRLDADGTLRCEVPVDGFAWMAQRKVDVPTPDGLHALPMQRDRTDYRLAGRGFPSTRKGPRGDLVVQLRPVFPERLSADQAILLDQLVAVSAAAGGPVDTWQRSLRAWARERQPPDPA